MAMAWVPHALAVAGMVLAQRMYVQCIKRLLLAGIEAAVESACGFVTLLGFCRALCAHFLRQVQTFGGGQRAQVCARSLALSPWCRRGGFDILLPRRFLLGLQLQNGFQALVAFCMELGKVSRLTPVGRVACSCGHGGSGQLGFCLGPSGGSENAS